MLFLGRSSATLYIYDPDTNRVIYDDYYGTFDAETSTFTITEGLKYNPRYEREDLPAPITFTTLIGLTHMYKVWDEGEEWEHIDKRDLTFTQMNYNKIIQLPMKQWKILCHATKEAGISTTKWSRVSMDDLPAH